MNASQTQGYHHMLSDLLDGIVSVDGSADCEIHDLSLDSRHVEQGCLFFACAGHQAHGLDYLDQVCGAGVAAVAWEPDERYPSPPRQHDRHGIPFIAIEGLSQQVGIIADRFFGQPSAELIVIGITGTDGKTSCCHFLAHALSQRQLPTGMIGTLGYGLVGSLHPASHTTPDAIRVHRLLRSMCDEGAQYVVMEVSSHALDQARVNGVRFEMAILTNISRDHLDYHGNQTAYAAAKERLFRMQGLQFAILNLDDAFGRQWHELLRHELTVIGYGLQANDQDAGKNLYADNIRQDPAGTHWHVTGPWGEGDIDSHLYGRFNVYNLLAALAALNVLGVSWHQACESVSHATAVPGRMEFLRPEAEQTLPVAIVDYAHTPEALEQVLSAIKQHGFGHIWCVFGCGGDRDRGKRPLMGAVAMEYADRVVLTDDNPRTESGDAIIEDILHGIEQHYRVHIERDRTLAITWAMNTAADDDVVLIAGKGHEDYQIIGDRRIAYSDTAVVQEWYSGRLH